MLYQDGSYPEPVEVGAGGTSEIDIELPPIQVGDVNGDGSIDIGDVVFLINYLFISGPSPDPLVTGDVNCDGVINIIDLTFLVSCFGESSQECPFDWADVDDDGQINVIDLTYLIAGFGTSCDVTCQ